MGIIGSSKCMNCGGLLFDTIVHQCPPPPSKEVEKCPKCQSWGCEKCNQTGYKPTPDQWEEKSPLSAKSGEITADVPKVGEEGEKCACHCHPGSEFFGTKYTLEPKHMKTAFCQACLRGENCEHCNPKSNPQPEEGEKCLKTISGKHMWRLEVFDWKVGTDPFVMEPATTYLQCKLCGLVDDRKAGE